jgi:hypothetical protein
MPSTHASPAAIHWVVSEHSPLGGVHWPFTHLAPSLQSAFALHERTVDESASATKASDAPDASGAWNASDPFDPSARASRVASATTSIPEESNVAPSPLLPPSRNGVAGTHWVCPPDSLHTYPPGHPPLQSLASGPAGMGTQVDPAPRGEVLHIYPDGQSLDEPQDHGTQVPSAGVLPAGQSKHPYDAQPRESPFDE